MIGPKEAMGLLGVLILLFICWVLRQSGTFAVAQTDSQIEIMNMKQSVVAATSGPD